MQSEKIILKLRTIQRRGNLWRKAGLAVFALGVTSSLYAQTSSGTMPTFAMLVTRVGNIEQRLTKLEQRVTNDEIGSIKKASSPGEAPGPSKSMENRLAALEKAVSQLETSGKSTQKVGTRVTAPFEVTDSKGVVIMSVEGSELEKGNEAFGLKVAGLNGNYVQIGTNAAGFSGVRVYASDSAKNATVAMGVRPDGSGGVGVAGKNGFIAQMTDNKSGGGELQLSNSSGQIVSVIGANPANNEGHAVFTDAGGAPLVKIGAAGTHGDVLLGGPDKALAVWEMTLTGFH